MRANVTSKTQSLPVERDPPPSAEALAACRLCKARFGFAPRPIVRLSASAPILLVSQAPGARAHASGVPFDDPSGGRLRDWMGLSEKRFFAPGTLSIAPMGLCFPGHDAAGGDLLPPAICRKTWHDRILRELPGVRVTLVIGGLAQRWMLGRSIPVAQAVADWRATAPELYPLPHPSWRNTAWLNRNPWFAKEVVPHLRARIAEVLT